MSSDPKLGPTSHTPDDESAAQSPSPAVSATGSGAPGTVTRRDTLRLAAAVGALGAGLGTLLESSRAAAEPTAGATPARPPATGAAPAKPPAAAGAAPAKPPAAASIKLNQEDLGSLAIKIYGDSPDKEQLLLETFDLSQLIKLRGRADKQEQAYSVKLYYVQDKHKERTQLLAQEVVRVAATSLKIE